MTGSLGVFWYSYTLAVCCSSSNCGPYISSTRPILRTGNRRKHSSRKRGNIGGLEDCLIEGLGVEAVRCCATCEGSCVT